MQREGECTDSGDARDEPRERLGEGASLSNFDGCQCGELGGLEALCAMAVRGQRRGHSVPPMRKCDCSRTETSKLC